MHRRMALPQGVVALVVLAFGCVGAPKDADNAALYGAKPDARAFRSDVDRALQQDLKDPESRRIRFLADEPFAIWVGVRRPYGFGAVDRYYGYGMLVGVNAKNSYGGYTGERIWLFQRDANGVLRYWEEPQKSETFNWGSPSWAHGAVGPQ